MLIINRLIGFGASAGIVGTAVSFRTFTPSTSDSDTYSFSSVDIGPASANRYVVVVVHWDSLGADLSSATIGGGAATIHAQMTDEDDEGGVAIIGRAVSSGATANIAFTLTDDATRVGIGVYALYNLVSTTPHHTAANDADSISINVPANGILIGGYSKAEIGGVTWTNATEDYDSAVESNAQFSGASSSGLSAQTGLSLAVNVDGGALAAATWA